MQDEKFKEKVSGFISENKLDKAIKACMEEFDTNGTHYDEIVIISGDLHKWNSDDRKGLDPENKQLNKIRDSLIKLVNEHAKFQKTDSNYKAKELKESPNYDQIQDTLPEERKLDYRNQIKEKAKEEYPTDFEMQKFVIDQQTSAYQRLQTGKPKDIPNNIFESIRKKAKEEYQVNFEMQEFVEKQQIDAYRKMHSKKPDDIPSNVWEQIRDKAISDYPTNFEMQDFTMSQQISAYRELNKS